MTLVGLSLCRARATATAPGRKKNGVCFDFWTAQEVRRGLVGLVGLVGFL